MDIKLSNSKASLGASLSCLVSNYPGCMFKVMVWGWKGSLDFFFFKIRFSQRSNATGLAMS